MPRQRISELNGYEIKDKSVREDKLYYDEITVTKHRYNNETDYYITRIPKYDNNGDIIKLYVGDANDKMPTQYAGDTKTNLTINASLAIRNTIDETKNGIPIIISNGEIIRNNPMISQGVADNYLYLGITDTREIREYKVNSTEASTLLNDGCKQVFDVYYKLIANSEATNLNNVVTNETGIVEGYHPRQAIGVLSDDTIIILTSEGRTNNNRGLTSVDMQNILLDLACVNAWNMDGGGSTALIYKSTRLNDLIDDNMTSERHIRYTLNVKKDVDNLDNLNYLYNQIGNVNENILKKLGEIINTTTTIDITDADLNTLIGRNIVGFGNRLINSPTNTSETMNGYFINITHSREEHRINYNAQIFVDRTNDHIYFRVLSAGTFKPWVELTRRAVIRAKAVANDKPTNTLVADNTYQKIVFSNFIVTSTILEQVFDNQNDTTCSKFKLNGFSSADLKISINVDFNSTVEGAKYIRLLKNNDNVDIRSIKGGVDERYCITFNAIERYNEDDIISVEFYGSTGDKIERATLIIEMV